METEGAVAVPVVYRISTVKLSGLITLCWLQQKATQPAVAIGLGGPEASKEHPHASHNSRNASYPISILFAPSEKAQ